MKPLLFTPVFLKITLLTSAFWVAIGFIEYIAYPDLENIIRFLDALAMLFLPYFLSKHFEVPFSKNKLAIFSFFLGIYFISSCLFYTNQILLHHFIDREYKVQIAETAKQQYLEGSAELEKRMAARNIKMADQKTIAKETYHNIINNYSIETLASKPFRNLPYYLIFSLLATIAVLKFNQNYDE